MLTSSFFVYNISLVGVFALFDDIIQLENSPFLPQDEETKWFLLRYIPLQLQHWLFSFQFYLDIPNAWEILNEGFRLRQIPAFVLYSTAQSIELFTVSPGISTKDTQVHSSKCYRLSP